MTSRRQRFVAKTAPDLGWRIWDNKAKKWWGRYNKRHYEELLNDLNSTKRPEEITKIPRQLRNL